MMNAQQPPLSRASGAFPLAAQDHREQVLIIGASVATFAFACALPALLFQNVGGGAEQIWYGGMIFLLGWMGALVGQFAWFANLLLLGSWISVGFRWRLGAILFAAVALLSACQSFTLFGQPIPADEGGANKLLLTRFLPGFYMWVVSLIIAFVGAPFVRPRK